MSILCPHCLLKVHVFYTSEELKQDSARLADLFSKWRKTNKLAHYNEAKTAQEAYRRKFMSFNSKLERCIKPLTKERYQKEKLPK